MDHDVSLYDVHPDTKIKWAFIKDLSEKALGLPKWRADSFDKFATKVED